MDANPANTADPTNLIRQLDPRTIRQRLDDIDRERDALRVLLRAALRAQREQEREARHAQG